MSYTVGQIVFRHHPTSDIQANRDVLYKVSAGFPAQAQEITLKPTLGTRWQIYRCHADRGKKRTISATVPGEAPTVQPNVGTVAYEDRAAPIPLPLHQGSDKREGDTLFHLFRFFPNSGNSFSLGLNLSRLSRFTFSRSPLKQLSRQEPRVPFRLCRLQIQLSC